LERLTVEQLLELETFNQIDPPLAGRLEIMLAKIGAAICTVLGAKTKPEEFFTDYLKIAEESLKEKQEPKPRTAEDIAREFMAMGFQVVIGKPGEQ